MEVLILFSGGIDSTACINYFIKRNDNIHLLYFNYGQHNESKERSAAINVSNYYKHELNIVNIEGFLVPNGMIPGRNAFLLSLSLLKTPFKNGGIVIGLHDHSIYSDCTESFVNNMQSVFDIYCNGRIKILTPFLHWDKGDIINYAKSEKIPLDMVYSTSLNKECYIEKEGYEKE